MPGKEMRRPRTRQRRRSGSGTADGIVAKIALLCASAAALIAAGAAGGAGAAALCVAAYGGCVVGYVAGLCEAVPRPRVHRRRVTRGGSR